MNATYSDLYLLPMAKKNLAKYRNLARAASKLFKKHGVLRYREFVSTDLKQVSGIQSFKQILKLKAGEILIYATVEFKSEAHRNRVMKLLNEDPELMGLLNGKKPPFDPKRMVYGGFRILVDA